MPTHPVPCPACRATLDLPADLLGRAVRCSGCGTTFTAPPRPPAPPPVARPPARRLRDVDDEDDVRPARRRPPRTAARNLGAILGVAAAVVGGAVLLGAIGLAAYLMTGNPAAGPAAGPIAGLPVAAGPAAEPLAAVGGGKELSAEVLRRVKAATVRLDVTLANGDEGNGSGFLVHPEGLFVTNAHVVGYSRQDGNRPARTVTVVLSAGERDERKVRAQVFAADGDADLALVRVPPGGSLPAPLAVVPAAGLRETQDLYVFGFPLGDAAGKEITVSTTTVSSLRKENGVLTAVQVNGGMHPGNSGGPLTDRAGQVVAVAVAGIRGTTINFAIPGDQVEPFVRGQITNPTIKPATVTGRPRRPDDDAPPFLPIPRGPRFGPPGLPPLPRGPFG